MLMKRMLGQLVVPVLAAAAFQAFVAGESAAAPSTSRPSHRATEKSAAKPAVPASVQKSPITISLTSRLRQGNLVVFLDGVPVFNEEFQKPAFLISQTTTWDPVQVPAGKHRLTAKVHGGKGKTYLSGTYDLKVSSAKGIELRIRTKGDKLTVELAS